MEFLDPKHQRAHHIRLVVGYVLVATALLLTTLILLYRAYGYGVTRNGEVTQSGLVFLSSRPEGASIFVDGKPQAEQTNSRLLMASGQYTFELRRDGYHSWKRAIAVEGGSVVRYDYPVLFPSKLTTTTTSRYDAQPPLAVQSPDRRWLIIQRPDVTASFDVYDLNNPEKSPVAIPVPDTALTVRGAAQQWSVAEWSSDNKHVLLQHSAETDGATATEYVMLNREAPEESVNVSAALNSGNAVVSLRDKKFDAFYMFDAAKQTVHAATLDDPEPVLVLDAVLGFKSHGDNRVLFATTKGAAENKVAIKLREGDRAYTIRTVDPSPQYMLDIASYDNAWYVVVGSPAENRTYVYRNPVSMLRADAKRPLVPVQVLKASGATKVSFSDNARFVMAQGGQQIAVYDAEYDRGYAYALKTPLDNPQANVTWMDGHRMMGVFNAKVVVFDFDNANSETLVPASPAFLPFFDRDYEFLYTLTPQTVKAADGSESAQFVLTSTSLRTKADQ